MTDDPRLRHMQRLRQLRCRPTYDQSLRFLDDTFQRQIARPHRQLAGLAEHWADLIPPDLAAHTALESLQRGVLRVVVDSAARHYELDQLLRAGLKNRLIRAHTTGSLRQIKVRVGQVDGERAKGTRD